MTKHRKHNRSKRNSSPSGEAGVGLFFTTVLPFIERLESEDKILLVLPTDKDNPTQGCVISDSLATEINIDYVARMADNVRTSGTLEAYFDFRQRNPKWAAKHNPDQMLLNICRAARLVIAYRYGLQLGSPTPASPEGEELHSSELPNLDSLPLFITMMGGSLPDTGRSGGEAIPQSIGYELNGEITLEQYHPSENSAKLE